MWLKDGEGLFPVVRLIFNLLCVKSLGSSRALPLPLAPDSVCRHWERDGRWKDEWECLPMPSELKTLA